MSILNPLYAHLSPSISLLGDEAVLAQAWKKTDTHIRRHNWFADILELEHTSLLLPTKLAAWSADVKRTSSAALRPEGAMVVLAPKNAKWYFPKGAKGGWKPVTKKRANHEQPELRPLAHIKIKDQVLATTVMMCLADAVETLQGNTDPKSYDNLRASRKAVCSYGNRLFCEWSVGAKGPEARFRWGNATTYSQFFKDYERFLERPAEACRDAHPELTGERLYVVKLDLTKFYDCVDQTRLIIRLKALHEEYTMQCSASLQGETVEADSFWTAVEEITRWEWDPRSQELDPSLKSLGLPQGLVAGGFFANAYLVKFDQSVSGTLGQEQRWTLANTQVKCRVLDYCRYVDDIRLVIAIEEDTRGEPHSLVDIASAASVWFNGLLTEHEGPGNHLRTKREKSEAIAWEDFSVQGSTSRFMRGVQGQISTAPDPATLLQATGSLDHLLWLSEVLGQEEDVESHSLALARISLPKVDVRDDTIKRFAAFRLRSVLRLRRSMADPELPIDDFPATEPLSEREALDHEIEAIARKLVACWSRNPALVSVLRCGLDLFPSVDLLRPVLEALQSKLTKTRANQSERLVAIYVLADLFKAAAVETGLHRPESYPDTSDIAGYRAELMQLGLKLAGDARLPWYLHQQLALFFAVLRYPLVLSEKVHLIEPYRELHSALRLERPSTKSKFGLTSGLLIRRITGRQKEFVVWLHDWLDTLKLTSIKEIFDQIAMVDSKILEELWKSGEMDSVKWAMQLRRYLPITIGLDTSAALSTWPSGRRLLAHVAAHPENPFVQENALLKLAQKLLGDECKFLDSEASYTDQIVVTCADWTAIQDPLAPLKVDVEPTTQYAPPWATTPSWVAPDMQWAYRLGGILRGAVVGESDYTTRFYATRTESFDRYNGLQSTWFKRRMGLMPLTAGLGAEPTPVSPWLNEFIMRLLQWPGLEVGRDEIGGFEQVSTSADLLKLVTKRLKFQSTLYGRISKLPAYLLPVSGRSALDLSKFKVALVQTLMPKDRDFSASDPLMWTPAFRSRHRAQLASVCRLVEQKIAVSRYAQRSSDPEVAHMLDLIVFPELAVHPDDMWLLERLSDSTGAVIFAGQTFVLHSFLNRPINRGVWLLRQSSNGGRSIARVYQGKKHGIPWEIQNGVVGHRPYQVLVKFRQADGKEATLTGAICYDATDLHLLADMREVSDGFVIAALNKDINTFDNMAGAMHFHMYQPVMLANTGQYGGSTAQAPYKEHFERLISHVHGSEQAAISVFEIDLLAFKSRAKAASAKEKKSAPASFQGRP